jgi:predicted TIM-barrel fold metal-dependent hydrolase
VLIDCHAHIFPYLGGASGYDSVRTHLDHIQKATCTPNQLVRRKRDGAVVEQRTLWDGVDPGPGGLNEVNFRVAPFGRVEWTYEGESYYMQWQPPSNKDMASPPEYVLTQMDYLGVQAAVLQQPKVYGMLNEYHAEAARRWPERFIPLCQVNEHLMDQQSEIERLQHDVTVLGNRGLYVTLDGWYLDNYRHAIDDRRYFPFWEAVQGLKIPVFWELLGGQAATQAAYLELIQKLSTITDNFPGITWFMTHSFPARLFTNSSGRIDPPEELLELIRRDSWMIEILFPLMIGRFFKYPYYEVHPAIRRMYEYLGPEKLCWGTDMPNVERFCTYRHAFEYLYEYTPYIPSSHKELIFGGNTARLFGLTGVV